MSILESQAPTSSQCHDVVSLIVEGRSRDLGGFEVRRILPAPARKTVGPYIFFDEMGPAHFPPGQGINVRPHPHIGLSTVTYLFAGEILHRDSLGLVQAIQPGAVNLMTAGSGIVHSERTPPDRERDGQLLHGIQTWMALPDDQQEIAPDFAHYPSSDLPIIEGNGYRTTLIIGEALGERSPVKTYAQTLYFETRLEQGAESPVPNHVDERAVYVVSGAIGMGTHELAPGTMAILEPGPARLTALAESRVMVLGGQSFGPRQIWWNFVHTSRDRIERAKADWKAGNFDRVPGDNDFIPLPLD